MNTPFQSTNLLIRQHFTTMAALVSLSTAANVAAMISLADMAFKTGTQVFELYCRYRDASLSISQLVDEIRASTSNIAQARIFIQEFEASAFAIDNGHTLPQIQQLLCLMDQEFKLLRKFMQDMVPPLSGSWLDVFRQATSHLRWSLDDHKVAASCARLHRLSTYMGNSITITGRSVSQFGQFGHETDPHPGGTRSSFEMK